MVTNLESEEWETEDETLPTPSHGIEGKKDKASRVVRDQYTSKEQIKECCKWKRKKSPGRTRKNTADSVKRNGGRQDSFVEERERLDKVAQMPLGRGRGYGEMLVRGSLSIWRGAQIGPFVHWRFCYQYKLKPFLSHWPECLIWRKW